MPNRQLLSPSNPFSQHPIEKVSVDNLSDVQAYLNYELGILSNNLSKQLRDIKSAVLLDTADKKKIASLEAQTKLLVSIYSQLVKNGQIKHEITVSPANIPDVHVPEIKLPDIIIPEIKLPEINVPRPIVNVEAPNVTVEAPIIDLTNLQRMLEPLLRLTDLLPIMDELTKYPEKQQTFLEELARESNRNLSNMSTVFSGGSGSSDGFLSASGNATKANLDRNGNVKVSIGTEYTPQYAVIDNATSGDNTIVSAVSGKKIRVLQLFLMASGSVNTRFESGAGGTALTGQVNLIANTGFVLPFSPVGWFETDASALLNLELSGAVSVDGSLTYVEVG